MRRDLADIVARAAEVGLYGNLITSGIGLDRARVAALQRAGLEHVQLSLQDTDELAGDRIAHRPGAQAEKRRAAEAVREAGLPLTLNAVVHRHNLARLDAMIALAVEIGAERLEIAHVQYYGWALRNRAALLPTREQLNAATRTVEAARDRLAGMLVIDYVVPDYFASRPKACMAGLGPALSERHPLGQGAALPCRRNPAGPGISDRHRGQPRRDLVPLRGVRAFPRHGMDARTVPVLRGARDRLGRMPLPGFRADRRRRADRPRLRLVPGSFPARGRAGGCACRGGRLDSSILRRGSHSLSPFGASQTPRGRPCEGFETPGLRDLSCTARGRGGVRKPPDFCRRESRLLGLAISCECRAGGADKPNRAGGRAARAAVPDHPPECCGH